MDGYSPLLRIFGCSSETDSVESSFSVRGFQCLYRERMVFFRGTAMDDYEIDLSHKDCVLNKSVLADGIPTRTLSKDFIAFKS